MAFADDLCIITASVAGLQATLNHLHREASFAGLKFSQQKCIPYLEGRLIRMSLPLQNLTNTVIPLIEPNERGRYLGAMVSPTGKLLGKTLEIF